mgnify:CR=1 FL=1
MKKFFIYIVLGLLIAISIFFAISYLSNLLHKPEDKIREDFEAYTYWYNYEGCYSYNSR